MKNFLILSLLLAFLTTEVCAQWKPAGDKIKTQWANKINTSAVLPEYPRPIMERNEWKNLNGKHSKKCTFYTLRFGCSFAAVNTIKPQLL